MTAVERTLEFSQMVFTASFFIYVVGMLFAAASLAAPILNAARRGAILGGLTIHTVGEILRAVALAQKLQVPFYAPMSNTYEVLFFMAWSTILASVIIEGIYKERVRLLSLFVLPLAIAFMGSAVLFFANSARAAFMPALRSIWLPLHVSITLLGYGCFAVGFVASILLIVKNSTGSPKLPPPETLDDVSYKSIAVGFPLFTLGGLIFGAIWANYAWGRPWSWDPKETWSLITFLVYAVYLHTRLVMNWRRASSYIAIAGFAVTMFTFLGANYLLSGLHSYGK
ncbi:MAG: c-type cytochrome biogenesis protein CcsB [bacterium]